MLKRVLFLVGPTGSGKSKLALALAQKINGEIVSCDSMQVYRAMDIGTAKPTTKEQKLVPHHLIDLISPRTECSVFKHRQLTLKAMDQILARGRTPVIVGGSGLYFKALVDGLTPQPGKQAKIREKLEKLAKLKGVKYLYSQLKKIDQKRAHVLHPNDKRRIIRALEILESPEHVQSDSGQGTESLSSKGIEFSIFGLLRERKELYDRIKRRVDQMFQAGWIDEVKRIKRVGLSKTAKAAIGYQEILEHLEGKRTLEEAKTEIKKRTRHLAKKQMTWFRKDQRIKWILVKGDRYQLAINQIIKAIPSPIKGEEMKGLCRKTERFSLLF